MIEDMQPVRRSNVGSVVLLVVVLMILAATLMALGGCVAGVRAGTTAGNAQLVYQAESDYAVALQTAVAYRQLPRCGTGLCHSDAVVLELQTADAAASRALKTAQYAVQHGVASPGTITEAINTVQAFIALAATVKVK